MTDDGTIFDPKCHTLPELTMAICIGGPAAGLIPDTGAQTVIWPLRVETPDPDSMSTKTDAIASTEKIATFHYRRLTVKHRGQAIYIPLNENVDLFGGAPPGWVTLVIDEYLRAITCVRMIERAQHRVVERAAVIGRDYRLDDDRTRNTLLAMLDEDVVAALNEFNDTVPTP